MALIHCPECGAEISDSAEACPRCGYPMKKKNTAKRKAPAVTAPSPTASSEVRQGKVTFVVGCTNTFLNRVNVRVGSRTIFHIDQEGTYELFFYTPCELRIRWIGDFKKATIVPVQPGQHTVIYCEFPFSMNVTYEIYDYDETADTSEQVVIDEMLNTPVPPKHFPTANEIKDGVVTFFKSFVRTLKENKQLRNTFIGLIAVLAISGVSKYILTGNASQGKSYERNVYSSSSSKSEGSQNEAQQYAGTWRTSSNAYIFELNASTMRAHVSMLNGGVEYDTDWEIVPQGFTLSGPRYNNAFLVTPNGRLYNVSRDGDISDSGVTLTHKQ